MFEVTFLGHQGWLVRSPSTCILIDPILTERFGHGGHVGRVYPPRRIDVAAFPPVDAVVVTHEHDDHFDIPSLHRIDRDVPIHLSSRSSVAAFALLRQMGFEVAALPAGATTAIGELRYRTFAPEHREARGADEWDVFPFVVSDVAGHGSFASSVDVAPPEAMLRALAEQGGEVGVWAHANNITYAGFADALGTTAGASGDDERMAAAFARRYARIVEACGAPQRTLVCGSGWSVPAPRRWLNTNAFPVSCEALARGIAARCPGIDVAAARAGETTRMADGRVQPGVSAEAFLATTERATWPDRDYRGDVTTTPPYEPACRRRTLTDVEREQLPEALTPLAEHWYARDAFRALHSLPEVLPRGLEAAVGLSLLDDGAPLTMRYLPSACAFVPDATVTPIATFASGLECWGSDLLDLLRGDLPPTALCNAGRLRYWNHDPTRLRIAPDDLWTFAQPLRRPAAAQRVYVGLLRAEPTEVAVVPARR
ncbi:MAG: MBL fold metallo-hydrolase [Myxococcota bacterium]